MTDSDQFENLTHVFFLEFDMEPVSYTHLDVYKRQVFFSHPDYTVGPGIPPDQPPKRVADYNRR